MDAIQRDEEAVFHVARQIADREARDVYLDQVCGDDGRLRRRVERLLLVCEREVDFLAAPPYEATGESSGEVERPGATIGPYKLLEPIGEGGMGAVYMAEQTEPVRRRVALKVIKPGMDSRQVVARFEAERQALAMMDHPNIARVLDAGMTPSGRPYFVMELVRGLPITDYCDREGLTITERLELFVLVCRAVQHAHQKGVIHRDLKPSNVLVTMIDGVAVPKVIDFGVAKATGQALTDKTLFTGFHQFVGTPLYVSPEQADLSGVDVDTRSDIYSLGVLLYELLTGTTPFDSDTLKRAAFDEMRRIIREEEPPRPSTRLSTLGERLSTVSARRKADPGRLGPSLKGELDWVVMKALEKDRRRRYETANDFATDVMRFLTDQPVEACPPSAWYRFTKYARRNRAPLTTAAFVAGALLFGLVASVVMAARAVEAEGRTAAALGRVRVSLAEADRQRARARRAVDEMYTQVAQRWLPREGGLTPIQREFLEKALAFYEDFAREQADDPEARADVARAAGRVGQIQGQLGRSPEAMRSHRKSLDTWRLLAAEFPNRPEYRRGVAESLFQLGTLQASLDQVRDAEQALREALALRERLAEAPGLPDDRAELAVSLRNLGKLLDSTGRRGDGERAALRGIELLDRLVSEYPREARYRSLLASAEMQLGFQYLDADRSPEAETMVRRALELNRRLADEDPADPEGQFGLARSYHSLAGFFRSRHRPNKAAEEFRHALPIVEKLVDKYPDRPAYHRQLAITLQFLAEQLLKLQRFDKAEQTLRRSRQVAEKLTGDFPEVPVYRAILAAQLSQLGAVYATRGKNREAREAFERAYEITRKLVGDHPGLAPYRHDLAATCYAAAVNYATLGAPGPGDAARARELAREAVEIEPQEAGFWKGLALAEYRAGDLDAALRAETKALEIRKSDGYDYDWLLLALIHLERGDREQARKWAGRLLQGRAPGDWSAHEPDFVRLARGNEPRLRALLDPDPK